MIITLTDQELNDLTRLERPTAQAKWLRENGIPFLVRADGTLAVSRSAVEAKLGGLSDKHIHGKEPNWGAL